MNRALVLIKPDAFDRNIVGYILKQLISTFEVEHIADRILTDDLLDLHYFEHREKPFFPSLKSEMIGKKVLALELHSKNGVQDIRSACEDLRSWLVDPTYVGARNIVHCSDSDEAADFECELWFGTKIQTKKPIEKSYFLSDVLNAIENRNFNKDLAYDLSEVSFDWENFEYNVQSYKTYFDELLGHQEVEGVHFLGIVAGGDWECSIFIAFYLDDKNQIRAFIPKNGNTWNHKTNQALGNDQEEDALFLSEFLEETITPDVDNTMCGEELFDAKEIKKEIVEKLAKSI